MWYYNNVERQNTEERRRKALSKKKHKKSDNENRTLECIVFITAILNLIQAVADLIKALFD